MWSAHRMMETAARRGTEEGRPPLSAAPAATGRRRGLRRGEAAARHGTGRGGDAPRTRRWRTVLGEDGVPAVGWHCRPAHGGAS
jgi:hypothetical protein